MTPSKMRLSLSLLIMSLPLAACGDKDDDTGAPAEADADTDSDTDSDTDADTDADTDTDTDTDTDADILVAITSPSSGEAFDATTVELSMTIQGFDISTDVGGGAVDGEGHYHVYVDGTYYDYGTDADSFYVANLSEGEHDLKVALANNDHSELEGDGVSDSVSVTINTGASGLNLDAPENGATINSGTIFYEVSTNNFTLDPDGLGDTTNVEGSGHYHIYLDGSYYDATASSSGSIQNVAEGDHLVAVVPAENDHTERDGLDWARVTVAEGRPDIEITSPPNGETVTGDFTVTIAVENFTFSEENAGGANVEGEGHWHLYVDDAYYSFGLDTTMSVTGVGAGEHTLRAELHNNDHSELDDRAISEIDITVQ